MKEKKPILKNKFYLYLTEFFSGMSVMAVELGASRLIDPLGTRLPACWGEGPRSTMEPGKAQKLAKEYCPSDW